MTDPAALEALSKSATQGEWWAEGPDYFGDYNLLKVGETSAIGAVVSNLRDPIEVAANAAFIVALVNAHRTGQLVPREAVEVAVEAFRTQCLEVIQMEPISADCADPVLFREAFNAAIRLASAEIAALASIKENERADG